MYFFRITILLFFMLSYCAADLSAQRVWKKFGELQQARSYFGAVAISPNQILVMGGYINASQITASCEILDVARRAVIPAAPMNIARSETVFLLTRDSDVVALSGMSNGNVTPLCELYNRQTNKWSILGSLSIARRQHTACFLNDDEILVVGGRDSSVVRTLSDAEIFNIRTGKSRTVANFPFPINLARCMISSQGKPIVLGGRSGGASSFRSLDVNEFDAVSNRWIQTSSLQDNVAAPVLLKLPDGKILVSGGSRSESSSFDLSSMNQREGYPNFVSIAPLSIGRHWHSLVQWNADTVMAIGGHNNNLVSVNTVDWIDLKNNRSGGAPSMLEAHSVFTAIALPQFNPSGQQIGAKVLAIAGASGGSLPTATVEIFEDTISSIPQPPRPIPIITSVLSEASDCGVYRLTLQASTGAIVRVEPSTGANISVEIQTQLPSALIELTIRLVNPFLTGTIPSLHLTDDQNRLIVVTITATLTPIISNIVTPILLPQKSVFGDSSSTMTCATILLHNASTRPITFSSTYITHNTEFSAPLSQFPIVVPPNGEASLQVCYAPSSLEVQRDTAILKHDCFLVQIPLFARGATTLLAGDSRCAAPVSLRVLRFADNSHENMIVSVPFPHPASNYVEFILSFTIPTDERSIITSVHDRLGVEVMESEIEQSSPQQFSIRVRTISLASGVYFVRVRNGEELLTVPFVVVH